MVEMPEKRPVVTTTQAMEMLDVSRATVSRLIKRGELSGYRLTPAKNSDFRIYIDSIREFMKRREF